MKKLFLDTEKTDVGYYYIENKLIPKFLHKDIEPKQYENFGCPAISTMKNKVFNIYPMVSMEIEFYNDTKNGFYDYKIDTKNFNPSEDLHNFIKECLIIDFTDKAIIQVRDIYTFVTDDSELFLTIIPNENLYLENAEIIIGSFYPYGWIRPLNLALKQIDPTKKSKVIINENEPMFRVLFNKSINLKKIKPTEEMLEYEKYQHNITFYLKNIKKRFPNIITKRPKKFL